MDYFLNFPHGFSIGFKSGLFAGLAIELICLSGIKAMIPFALIRSVKLFFQMKNTTMHLYERPECDINDLMARL